MGALIGQEQCCVIDYSPNDFDLVIKSEPRPLALQNRFEVSHAVATYPDSPGPSLELSRSKPCPVQPSVTDPDSVMSVPYDAPIISSDECSQLEDELEPHTAKKWLQNSASLAIMLLVIKTAWSKAYSSEQISGTISPALEKADVGSMRSFQDPIQLNLSVDTLLELAEGRITSRTEESPLLDGVLSIRGESYIIPGEDLPNQSHVNLVKLVREASKNRAEPLKPISKSNLKSVLKPKVVKRVKVDLMKKSRRS